MSGSLGFVDLGGVGWTGTRVGATFVGGETFLVGLTRGTFLTTVLVVVISLNSAFPWVFATGALVAAALVIFVGALVIFVGSGFDDFVGLGTLLTPTGDLVALSTVFVVVLVFALLPASLLPFVLAAPLTLFSVLLLTSVVVLPFPLAFFSVVVLPLPFPFTLDPTVALPFPLAFFSAEDFPFPLTFFSGTVLPLLFAAPFVFLSLLAGAVVGLDFVAAVGLILDKRISAAVGFALDGLAVDLGALGGIGGLTTSLYGPVLADLAGVGLALTRVGLVGAAFPLSVFF